MSAPASIKYRFERNEDRADRFDVVAVLYREGEGEPYTSRCMAYAVTAKKAKDLDRAYTQATLLSGLAVIA